MAVFPPLLFSFRDYSKHTKGYPPCLLYYTSLLYEYIIIHDHLHSPVSDSPADLLNTSVI